MFGTAKGSVYADRNPIGICNYCEMAALLLPALSTAKAKGCESVV